MVEMRRVLKPLGHVAVRDADYSSMLAFPALRGIDEWRRIYRAVATLNGAQPDAGRYLGHWLAGAGFSRGSVVPSLSVVPHLDAEATRGWGKAWEQRALESDFARQAVEYGVATWAELEAISRCWGEWGEAEGAVLYYVNGEALAQKQPS